MITKYADKLRAGLEELDGLDVMTAAKIALQHQPGVTPPYQAVAVLVVPGPDIQAAARPTVGRTEVDSQQQQ